MNQNEPAMSLQVMTFLSLGQRNFKINKTKFLKFLALG